MEHSGNSVVPASGASSEHMLSCRCCRSVQKHQYLICCDSYVMQEKSGALGVSAAKLTDYMETSQGLVNLWRVLWLLCAHGEAHPCETLVCAGMLRCKFL
jgi:hypothetical protein